MSRKFNRALKGLPSVYPSPDPDRMNAFLEQLPAQEKEHRYLFPLLHMGGRPLRFMMPAVAVAAVMLVAGIGVYQNSGQHKLPYLPPQETIAQTATDAASAAASEAQQGSGASPSASAPQGADLTEQEPPQSTSAFFGPVLPPGYSPVVTPPAAGEWTTDPVEPSEDDASPTMPAQTSPAQTSTEEEPATVEDPAPTRRPQETSATDPPMIDPAPPVTDPGIQEPTASPPTDIRHPTDEPPFAPSDSAPSACPDPTAFYEPTDAIDTTEQPPYRDLRVSPLYKYSVSGHVVPFPENVFEPGDELHYGEALSNEELRRLINASDLIVLADVTDCYYTRIRTEAWTQLNLSIRNVIKGDCNAGDQISVYEHGGYILLWEYRMIADVSDGYFSDLEPDTTLSFTGIRTTGGMYLFFLRHAQLPNIPSRAFVYAKEDAISRYHQLDGDLYSSANERTLKFSDVIRYR